MDPAVACTLESRQPGLFLPISAIKLIYNRVSPYSLSYPRVYTVTHSDETGEIYVSIGRSPDQVALGSPQVQESKDEVLGFWSPDWLTLGLEVREYIGQDRRADKIRHDIFCGTLPRVLEWLVDIERPLFSRYPDLLDAKVVVIFKSPDRPLCVRPARREEWGQLKDYSKPENGSLVPEFIWKL